MASKTDHEIDHPWKGKEIDWSLVIPSISRPFWEPPALEVFDGIAIMLHGFQPDDNDEVYDNDVEVFDLQSARFRARYPDVAVRLRLVDLWSELVPLSEHTAWAGRTYGEAKEVGDQEKIAFYEGLAKNLAYDMLEVFEELRSFYTSLGLESSVSTLSSKAESEREGSSEPESFDVDSTSSYVTAKDDISTNSDENLAQLTQEKAGATNQISVLLASTDITNKRDTDRSLRQDIVIRRRATW